MISNKIKAIVLALSALLTFNANANNKIAEQLNEIAKKHENEFIRNEGANIGQILINRMMDKTILTKPKAELIEGKPTSFKVTWFINKKRIARYIQGELPLYEGEIPEKTKSSKPHKTVQRNNLYFFLKPLGQKNGLTFDLTNKYFKTRFYREVLEKFQIFIEARVQNNKYLIPIASTSSKPGCGDIFNDNKHELFCFQTSSGAETELNIGYKNGMKNTFKTPFQLKSSDDISLKYIYFFNNKEIL